MQRNAMSVGVSVPLRLGTPIIYSYIYDQLNRLTKMDAYTGLNTTTNIFAPISMDDYKERLTYDPNGNIKTYLRNGTGASINLNNYSYAYTAGTNKLASIANAVNAQTKSYVYDEVGNTTTDGMQGITNAVWNVYGKLQSATNAQGQNIVYTYNSSGQRVSKKVGSVIEFYVRDASGNEMATYKLTDSLRLTELPLYGSNKIGALQPNINMQAPPPNNGLAYVVRKNKIYYLYNYKGDVVATIYDALQQHSTNGTTIDYNNALVLSANYFSSFGSPSKLMGALPSIGFNGQKRSPEISPDAQTAEFWEYNGDVGRRANVDPKPNTNFSPYSVFEDNPIWHNDIKGDSTGGPGPAPVQVGTGSFYKDRVQDFIKRHLHPSLELFSRKSVLSKSVPSYYLNYGNKYMNKFKNVTRSTLTKQGQKWLDNTLINLQQAIENKLVNSNNAQDKLIENDDEKFTDFAFDTHVAAYEKAGVLSLPIMDKVKIGLTPDAKDLFSDRGLKQAGQIALDQTAYYLTHPIFAQMQAIEVAVHAKEITTMVHSYYIANKQFFDEISKANPQGWSDPEHQIIKQILTPPSVRF